MIICFSGTGNTRIVAEQLGERLGETRIVHLRGQLLTAEQPRLDVDSERVIWCFPVYSWGVPPVVRKWIERTDFAGTPKEHFVVATCGDDAGLLARQWRGICCKKFGNGAVTPGVYTVQMPNTYVFMKGFDVDSPELAQAKLDAMPARVDAIADAITSGGGTDDVVAGRFAWVKTAVIYPWFVRFDMSPKPFHATDACVGCGACVRVCPMENIRLNAEHRPQWGSQCALCSGCYHVCPVHAVAYGKTCRNKGQKAIL